MLCPKDPTALDACIISGIEHFDFEAYMAGMLEQSGYNTVNLGKAAVGDQDADTGEDEGTKRQGKAKAKAKGIPGGTRKTRGKNPKSIPGDQEEVLAEAIGTMTKRRRGSTGEFPETPSPAKRKRAESPRMTEMSGATDFAPGNSSSGSIDEIEREVLEPGIFQVPPIHVYN
jgi:hypothetical protein